MRKLIKWLKEIDFYEFLIIYFSLLLFSGFWFFEYGLTEAMLAVGGLLIFLKVIRKDLNLNVTSIIIFFSLIYLVISSEILSYTLLYNSYDFPLVQILVTLASILIAFMFSETISINKFKKNFIICMVIIAFVSLIGNLIYTVNPSLITIFPKFTNSHGRSSYFLVFSMVSNYISRNQGIFWEPGAFQFFLCLAYIFEITNKKPKPKKWVLFLFIISIITSKSTTGIIISLLLITYTLSRYKGKSNVIKGSVVILLLLLVLLSFLPNLDGYWEYALVGKIQELFNYQSGIQDTSARMRMDALYFPLTELTNSPLWGLGSSGYEKMSQDMGHSILTFTPVNLIAIYGPVYGLIVIMGIYKFIKSNFRNTFDTIIIFSILMLSTTTEALQNNVFILIMCFMGWNAVANRFLDTDIGGI